MDRPTVREIETAYLTVLESPTFRRKRVLREMLRILGEHAVAVRGKSSSPASSASSLPDAFTEETLGQALYPGWIDGNAARSSIIRTTVGNLRKALGAYYATDGMIALVLISFAQDDTHYRLQFDYNPYNAVIEEVALGWKHADRQSPHNLTVALRHFDRAIELDACFAGGHAGRAAVLCELSTYDAIRAPKDYYAAALTAAERAVALNPDDWRAQSALATVYGRLLDWPKTEAAWAVVVKLDPVAVQDDRWFYAYLIAVGRTEDAISYSKALVGRRLADPVAMRSHAINLHAVSRHAEALTYVQKALDIDPAYWSAHGTCALVCLALDRPADALVHARQMEGATPGLEMLCLMRAGHTAEARKMFVAMLRNASRGSVTMVQMALGYLAMDDQIAAINCLSQACDECDPLIDWLDVWPILEPLRTHPNYQALVTRLGFPHHGE